MEFFIRDIDINADIQGVREVHSGDDHWGSFEACFHSGKTSLENGFFIQVAVCGGKVVGHAEWVISDEPDQKFLYLGILQVHNDFQRRGVGTGMIKSGAEYAKQNGCAFLRTMPNKVNGSSIFYQKNSFIETGEGNNTLKLRTTTAPVRSAVPVDCVPFGAVKALPFCVGLYQHASAHIWKIYNARHIYDDRRVASFDIGGAYVNVGAFEPYERASVTCWARRVTRELIDEILAVGGSLGYQYMNFCVLNGNVRWFDGFEYEMSEEHDIFIERRL